MKSGMIEGTIAEKLDRVLWERIESDLDVYGGSILEHLLTPEECDTVTAMYADDAVFRSRVVMARHGLDAVNTSIFDTHCPILWRACGPISIHDWHLSRIAGTRRCGAMCAIRRGTRSF
jgi:hypothetical protein